MILVCILTDFSCRGMGQTEKVLQWSIYHLDKIPFYATKLIRDYAESARMAYTQMSKYYDIMESTPWDLCPNNPTPSAWDRLRRYHLTDPLPFNRQDLLQVGMTGIVALADTTGTTLAYSVWLLGLHPTAQEKCRAEVDEFFTSNSICDDLLLTETAPGELNPTKLSQMKYLKWCIMETLRLFPSIPAIMRRINLGKSDRVTLDGVEMLDQTTLIINIFAIHRNAKYWDKPNEFHPDRFDGEKEDLEWRLSNGYMPFLGGKRHCPGAERAYTYLTIALAYMLRRYTWTSEGSLDELQFKCNLVIETESPLIIHLKPRASQ